MNIRKILSLLICIGSGVLSYGQDKWDLKRAVEYALANNISVKQADIQARVSALTFNQSRLNQFPSLNVSADAGINSGRSIDPTTNLFTTTQLFSSSISVQTGITVFNFFSIRNEIAGNRLDNKAAIANVEKIKNDIALNVATAYLQVLVSAQQINIAEVAVQQTNQNIDNTRKRVEAGALPELNLAELEAQLASDSTTLITAKANLQTNILQLKAILNLDAASPFVVDIPPFDQIPVQSLSELQPEDVYSQALIYLPQQKVNDLRIEAARKFVDASRGRMYPSLGLFAGLGSAYSTNKNFRQSDPVFTGIYDTTNAKVNVNNVDYPLLTPRFDSRLVSYLDPFGLQMSDNFRQNIGLSLNIPIFNNGTAKTNWQRSKLNVVSLQLQKDQDLLTLKQNIYTAYNDALASVQKFAAGKKGVATAEKAYSYAQKRYDQGLLSTIDLLTNQNNLNTARLQLVQAQVDYVFRLKLLEFYKGQGIKLQ